MANLPHYMNRLLLFIMMLSIAFNSNAQQQKSDNNIQAIERNSIDNIPTTITFSERSALQKGQVAEIFHNYLGTDGVKNKSVLVNTTTTKQYTTIEKYEQYYEGVKVEYGAYKVLYDKEWAVRFMNGNFYDITNNLSPTPVLNETKALAYALTAVQAETYAWQVEGLEKHLKEELHSEGASYYPKGELVWIEDFAGGQHNRKLHLAYKFNIYAIKPLSREEIYVDATTGKILHRNSLISHVAGSGASLYSGTVGFQTSILSGTNKLRDSTRGSGINTFTCGNTTGSTISEITSASTTWASDVALDAHWGAEKVYDYWLLKQGRNSYDNTGAAINSYVHYGISYNNAFWNGSQMTYGDGSGLPGGFAPLASLDVCAHEIGHAVCQYTATLAYNGESGAMNEGFSDIWGAIIEEYANPFETDAMPKSMWKMGEEISTYPLRRLDNPNIGSQPDTYGGSLWYSLTSCSPSSANDYCGVHTNSGVLNYWFYLVCMGGSGTNDIGNAFSVSGIGTTKGANIVYQTELMLTSTSNFASCRTASISVATLLYGACSPEVEAVTRAWYAVGIGANYSGGTVTAITGTAAICLGTPVTLTIATTGGTWSSSNTAVATITSGGIVTGVASGTSNITYLVAGGCYATKTVTVSTSISAGSISGSSTICSGTTTLLTDGVPGGVWSSSNTSVATIGSSTGIVSGVAAGTTIISYSVTNGCGSAIATFSITVTLGPSAITGTTTVNIMGSSTLSNTIPGGTWASSNVTIATVGSSSGIVTGVATGTAIITYALSNGCYTTVVVAVGCFAGAGIITTILGTGTAGNGPSGGMGTSTDINTPWGITADAAGNTYVCDFSNNKIRKVSPSGITTIFAGTGVSGFTGDGGPATAAKISQPTGMSISGTDIYFVDLGNGRVRKINAAGIISTVAGGGASSAEGVAATNAALGSPNGLFVDAAGNIYIPSQSPPRVRKVNTSGIITTIAGNGTYGSTGDGGQATNAQFMLPNGVVVDNAGNVFIADYNGNKIRKITAATGIVNTYVGTGAAAYFGDGGPATAAKIRGPAGMTFDVSGNLIICDVDNHRIRKINAATGVITTYAGTGTGGFSGDGGTADTAKLNRPHRIYCDAGGVVYFADVNNQRARKITPLIATITGDTSICVGELTTFSGTPSGGTWGSSNPSIATIGSSSGNVTGILAGTTTIIYTPPSTACPVSVAVTVNPTPSIIGPNTVCVGSTTVLTTSSAGGTWSSGSPAIATISPFGVVTGISAGTSIITYTSAFGCTTTRTMTVQPLGTIGSTSPVCVGASITLIGSPGGGTWNSNDTTIAAVSSGGVVTGVSAGTTYITYRISFSCYIAAIVTVDPIPGPITAPPICYGNSATLTVSPSGGTWSSSNTAIATVGTDGVMTGTGTGTVTITYTLSTGCYITKSVTVGVLPTFGPATICVGSVAAFIPGGGTWVSSNVSVATVGSSSGMVTGISAGTAIISWTSSPGCTATNTLTVSASPGTTTGVLTVCVGQTTTLSNPTSGGTWSSGNTAIATVVPGTGVVSGVSAGTVDITYALSAICSSITQVTINAIPSAIGGVTSICAGATTTLTNTLSGGIWSSSNTSIATIGSGSGTVSGLTAGTSVITYIVNGCYTTIVVTVNNVPATIGGSPNLCLGFTTVFTNTTSGGTWSSSNTAVVTIGSSSGFVSAVALGTSIITYTVAGCYSTITVTVNDLPAAISGSLLICAGNTSSLSSPPGGGTWASGNLPVATIGGTTGVVMGVSAGTAIITYTSTAGCARMAVVTVSPALTANTGMTSMCVGQSTILSNPTSGGTWVSGNTGVAIIGSGTGVVSGISAGTSLISYLAGGCYRTTAVTINNLPGTISGSLAICTGSTSSLSSGTPGGTWNSSNLPVATIGSASGVVTGITAGTAIISYTNSLGCSRSVVVTVAPALTANAGAPGTCVGQTTTLSNSTSGGVWSSSNTSVAAAVAGTGVVMGMSAGIANITYTLTIGCYSVTQVTINPAPAAIGGTTSVCAGATTMLTHPASGGMWSSNNTTVAIIGSVTGVVSGVTAGTSIITYVINGCYTTKVITVNSLPAAITGPLVICTGNTSPLSSITPGCTWSSSNTAVATIGSVTGIVTGISIGTAIISYTNATGCTRSAVVTVSPALPANTGLPNTCIGQTTTLNNATSGGTWSSSNTTIATVVASTGLVTGVGIGIVDITYTMTSSCLSITQVTVNAALTSINGTNSVCVGATTTLTHATSGGTWSSSNAAVATVGSVSGIVSGITAGTSTITYVAGGCYTTIIVTVNNLPAAIAGSTNLCIGNTTTLTSGTGGGTWSSSNTAVAIISPSTGIVSGLTAGTSIITYVTTGCYRTIVVTVNNLPDAISGSLIICAGNTSSLSSATPGGTWSSNNLSVATIGNISGMVTGISAGTVIISYTDAMGCARSAIVTVSPALMENTGTLAICVGKTSILSNPTSGGTWNSSNTSVAMVGSGTGVISGVAAGTSIITYSLITCQRSSVVTVSTLPNTSSITGTDILLVGSSQTLTSDLPGGIWTSGDTTKASILETTGVMTGKSAGTVTITYSQTNNCGTAYATRVFNIVKHTIRFAIYPNPTSGPLTIESPTPGTLTVYTIDGRLVNSNIITATTTSITLSNMLARGVYMFIFNGNDGSRIVVKLVYHS